MASIDSLSIQITASTKSAKDKVDALVSSINNLVVAINSIDASKVTSLASSVSSLGNGLSLLKGANVKTITRIAEGLNNIATTGRTAFDPVVESEKKVEAETAGISQSLEQVNTDLKSIDPVSFEEVSTSAEKVSSSIERTSNKMASFKTLLSNLKIVVPTEDLDRVNNKISKLEDKIADLKDKLAYKSSHQDFVDDTEIEKDQAQLQGLINELERLKLKQQELQAHGGFKFNGGNFFSGISKSISDFHGKVSSLSKKLDGLASKFHHVKRASSETTKSTDYLKTASDRLVKSLTKVTRMLRLMVLRMALRTVIKEVGNGFKSLALHSEEFDRAMSNLRNSAKTLGYSFSAMVAPLLQALAPALIYIINLLMKLMNAINQVFAALSGKGTWNKAKDFTGKWSDDIKAANKEAKELKKTVLGFDELNQLQEKYTSGGDTSGNIEDMFETVAVEQKWKNVADYIKNLAKRLFDPIKKAWEKVGDFVKKSWKYAMDEVFKLGKSIARDFWKVWEQEKTQKIFENILKIIGWIGQTVGNLARQFRKAWDENDTGLHILENIRDIILIITEHFEKMAEATAKWAAELDFSPILTKFNEWLDSLKPVVDNLMGVVEDFYTTVILPLAKWATEEGGPQLLQVFIDFNEKVKWDELREKLKKLWEHVEPFMETVGEGLIIFIDRVAQALADFINSPEFEKFLEDVEAWMDKVTPQDVADGLEAIAKAILGFAIGKAVIDGLVAISGFLKLVASLAPLLKLTVTIAIAYAGLKFGGWLGKYFTDDDQLYEDITIPVTIKWIADEFPKSWDDLHDKLHDWLQAWDDMCTKADAFVQIISNIVELANPVANLFHKLFKADTGNVEGMTYSGGSGANVEAEEWQKTIEAAKEATEQAEKYKATKEDIPPVWNSGGSGANVESNEWDTVIKAAKEATGSIKKYGDEAVDTANRTKTIWGQGAVSAKTYKDEVDGLTEKQKQLKGIIGPLADDTGKLKTTTDNLATGYKNLKTDTGNLQTTLNNANTAYKNLKTGMETNVNYTPVLTSSMKEIDDYLQTLGKDTDTFTATNKTDWQTVDADVANAGVGFSGTMKEIQKGMDDTTKDLTTQTDKIAKSFTKDKWTFSGVIDGLKKTFEDALGGIKGLWNKFVDKINGDHEIGSGHFKINLPRFAYGGFPDEDGIFMANHTEMIGKFSNGKTAVANNAEIVEGISAGVYNAVSSAMARNGSGSDKYIANTIVVDGEVIARTITKAQQRQQMRYSPNMG